MLRRISGRILLWTGIAGGAVTLAGYWSNLITLAGWVRRIVEYWGALLQRFWAPLGSMLNIEIPEEISQMLSIFGFYLILALGCALSERRLNENSRKFFYLLTPSLFYLLSIIVYFFVVDDFDLWKENPLHGYVFVAAPVSGLMLMCLILCEGEIFETVSAILICLVLIALNSQWVEAFVTSSSNIEISGLAITVLLCFLFSLFVALPILVAPTRALMKHVTYLLIGIAFIFGLSEASKLVEHVNTAAAQMIRREISANQQKTIQLGFVTPPQAGLAAP